MEDTPIQLNVKFTMGDFWIVGTLYEGTNSINVYNSDPEEEFIVPIESVEVESLEDFFWLISSCQDPDGDEMYNLPEYIKEALPSLIP